MTTAVFPTKRPKSLENWTSKVSPKFVEKALKCLEEERPNFTGTANFIGVGTNHTDVRIGQSCHAAMQRLDERVVLATENGFKRKHSSIALTKEQARPFLSWFLYDSPYGFIILNRDDIESCEDYGFVLAGDAPTTLVQSACIISRHFYECYPRSFVEFNKLVERGIDGFIAYQICFNSNISFASLNTDFSRTPFSVVEGHRVTGTVNPEVMLNYYRGENQHTLGETYQSAPSIYGSSKLFIKKMTYQGKYCLQRYRQNSEKFHNFLLENEGKLKPVSNVYRPPNPFVPDYSQREADKYQFTLEQAVSCVADYCQDFIRENL